MTEWGTQIILSGAAATFVFFLYKRGLVKQEEKSKTIPGNGIPGNWIDDPVLKERHARNLQSNATFPKCQIWNDNLQLFFDVKDSSFHANQDACFLAYDEVKDNPRYAMSETNIVYKRQDPVKEDPGMVGTCVFQTDLNNPSTRYSFDNFPNWITPVNRSARLCLASGETPETAGRTFSRQQPATWYVQPQQTVAASGYVLPPTPRCETLTNDATYVGWQMGYNDQNDKITTLDACIAASTFAKPTRFNDGLTFTFLNPYTQNQVVLKNEVY